MPGHLKGGRVYPTCFLQFKIVESAFMSERLRPVQSLNSADIVEFEKPGNKQDLVIVGLGPVGAASAYFLSYFMREDNPEIKICALEGSSQIGAGQNTVSFEQFRGGWTPTELSYFMDFSNKFFDNPNFQAPGVRPHAFELQRMYYVWLFNSDEDEARLTERAQKMQAAEYSKAYIIDEQELTKLYPFTEGHARGALLDTGAGRVNSVAMSQQFARHALDNTKLFVNAPVSQILTDPSGQKVRGVRTEKGDIEAAKVLICGGHSTRTLVQTTGADIPTRAHRRESYHRAWTHIKDWSSPTAPPGFFITPNGAYFRQDGVGISAAWATPPEDVIEPVIMDTPRDPAPISDFFAPALLQELAEHLGEGFNDERYLSPRSEVERSAGWYCMRAGPDADDRQILDETDIEGLCVITAFGGHGVMASPSAGAYSKYVLDGSHRSKWFLQPFLINAQTSNGDNATI